MEKEEFDKLMAEYLASGGKITHLEYGETGLEKDEVPYNTWKRRSSSKPQPIVDAEENPELVPGYVPPEEDEEPDLFDDPKKL